MAEQKNNYPERYADAEYADKEYQDTNYPETWNQGQGYADPDDQGFGDQGPSYPGDSGYPRAQYRNLRYQTAGYADTPYQDDIAYQAWEYETPDYQTSQYRQRQPYRHQIASEPAPVKDVIFGLLGGVAGVIAMDIFSQQVMPLLTKETEGEESRGPQAGQQGDEQPLDSISLVGTQHRPNESATAALGRMLYHWATDEDPNKKAKTTLSYAVHWGYGIGQGGVYASVRGPVEGMDLAGGLAFGTALWLLGDELAVPMLGLQEGPTASGVTNHLNRLAMHLVYGVATAATTQSLRRLV